MLELAVLSCMRAQVMIQNMKGVELPLAIRQEIAEEIIANSDCPAEFVNLSNEA